MPGHAPEFVRTVTATMLTGRGDDLPVSSLPVDGTYPSGTTKFEKRNISEIVAEWDAESCIQCGNCAFVCPHAVLRAKSYPADAIGDAPEGFSVGAAQRRRPAADPLHAAGLRRGLHRLWAVRGGLPGQADRPAVAAGHQPRSEAGPGEGQGEAVEFFETIPHNDRARVDFGTVRGTQFLEPLFEFSGACSGCGETPYLKLLSQLFGDRATIANATGCSSIYGGNLPTTPWAKNAAGRGPAWSNSLFEDNAEFGLGMRLAADLHDRPGAHPARRAPRRDRRRRLVDAILGAPQRQGSELAAQCWSGSTGSRRSSSGSRGSPRKTCAASRIT